MVSQLPAHILVQPIGAPIRAPTGANEMFPDRTVFTSLDAIPKVCMWLQE